MTHFMGEPVSQPPSPDHRGRRLWGRLRTHEESRPLEDSTPTTPGEKANLRTREQTSGARALGGQGRSRRQGTPQRLEMVRAWAAVTAAQLCNFHRRSWNCSPMGEFRDRQETSPMAALPTGSQGEGAQKLGPETRPGMNGRLNGNRVGPGLRAGQGSPSWEKGDQKVTEVTVGSQGPPPPPRTSCGRKRGKPKNGVWNLGGEGPMPMSWVEPPRMWPNSRPKKAGTVPGQADPSPSEAPLPLAWCANSRCLRGAPKWHQGPSHLGESQERE